MKHRWIGGALVVAALALGGCAPRQGADDPSATPGAAGPTTTGGGATPSARPSAEESAAPTPSQAYDY